MTYEYDLDPNENPLTGGEKASQVARLLDHSGSVEYKLYWTRYLMIFMYFIACTISGMCWMSI